MRSEYDATAFIIRLFDVVVKKAMQGHPPIRLSAYRIALVDDATGSRNVSDTILFSEHAAVGTC